MGTIVTSEITSRVFVADWFVAQNWDALDALGMTHVVGVWEIPPIDSSKIAHMHVCTVDLPIADISDHFEKTTKLIRDALAQEGTKVLVCHLLELPLIARKLMPGYPMNHQGRGETAAESMLETIEDYVPIEVKVSGWCEHLQGTRNRKTEIRMQRLVCRPLSVRMR